MEENKIKIRTRTGKILTIVIEEQTKEYISGKDKFGLYVKIPLEDILESLPVTKGGMQND